MRSVLKYVLFAAAMYLVFLAGTLPAPWIYSHWLQPRLGGLKLYGVQGTVWEGRASVLRSGNIQVENAHWDLHPWALFRGRLEAALQFSYEAAPGSMVVGRSFAGNWYFDEVSLELPARQLTPLLRLPAAELGGKLAVQLSSLAVQQGKVTAVDGSVAWEKAALRKPVAVELGTFEMNLETNAEGVNGTLLDKGGSVQAQGLFKLNPEGQYQLTATFASRNPQQALITQGLQLFGTPGPDGRVKYSAAGVVPAIFPPGAG